MIDCTIYQIAAAAAAVAAAAARRVVATHQVAAANGARAVRVSRHGHDRNERRHVLRIINRLIQINQIVRYLSAVQAGCARDRMIAGCWQAVVCSGGLRWQRLFGLVCGRMIVVRGDAVRRRIAGGGHIVELGVR